MSQLGEQGYAIVGQLPPQLTQAEKEERLRYWEARLRDINVKGADRAEAQEQARLSAGALAAGTFPETPDFAKNGNVAPVSRRQNTGNSRDRHFQTGDGGGNVAQDEAQQEVENEIVALRKQRRGNVAGPDCVAGPDYAPRAIDDFVRGRLVTLLGMGLSIRQAAVATGLSHTAVRQEIKRNPALMAQVELAREHALLEPLMVIIRESKRSWRAASWLMKHLDGKRGAKKRKGK
ncbi:MAG: hypothetical protein L0211_12515 [Planctomycetaceae bacterium]|nr:hypothetical protein [Planctomycetaceae bacterium]